MKFGIRSLLSVPDKGTVNAIHTRPTIHTEDSEIQRSSTNRTNRLMFAIAGTVNAIRRVAIDNCVRSGHCDSHVGLLPLPELPVWRVQFEVPGAFYMVYVSRCC